VQGTLAHAAHSNLSKENARADQFGRHPGFSVLQPAKVEEQQMPENIDINTTIVKPETNDFAEQLEKLAREIEQLHAKASLQIAQRLAQARDLFRYRRDEGGFTGWVQNRLGYSVATAYRLVNLYQRFGESFSQWQTLPITALYALAAPGTPEETVAEIAGRIEAGDQPSCVEVNEAIARQKAQKRGPDCKFVGDPDRGDEGHGADHSDDQAVGGKDHGHASADSDHDLDQHVGGDDHGYADQAGDLGQHDASHADDRHGDDQFHAAHVPAGIDLNNAVTSDPKPPTKVSTASKAALKRSLAEVWQSGSDEDQQTIRELVLEEFFARVDGADLYRRIPKAQHDDVVRDFLDR
jgi:hypothetical protein